jgi:hypothetical protein
VNTEDLTKGLVELLEDERLSDEEFFAYQRKLQEDLNYYYHQHPSPKKAKKRHKLEAYKAKTDPLWAYRHRGSAPAKGKSH